MGTVEGWNEAWRSKGRQRNFFLMKHVFTCLVAFEFQSPMIWSRCRKQDWNTLGHRTHNRIVFPESWTLSTSTSHNYQLIKSHWLLRSFGLHVKMQSLWPAVSTRPASTSTGQGLAAAVCSRPIGSERGSKFSRKARSLAAAGCIGTIPT